VYSCMFHLRRPRRDSRHWGLIGLVSDAPYSVSSLWSDDVRGIGLVRGLLSNFTCSLGSGDFI
jgi:hypothetical protein